MSLFKKIKDKAIDKFFDKVEENDRDNVNDEVGYSAEDGYGEQEADNEYAPPPYDGYSYSPTGGMDTPEYQSSAGNSYASASEFRFSRPAEFSHTPVQTPEFKPAGDRKSANIYSMNSVRALNKFKLNSITLKDIYGSKDVALLMMEKDTIILVDFSMLDEEQKVRAMDFIDGAKCVTKSVFGRLNDDIVVFVPENVELQGDFQSQLDFDSIQIN